MRAPFRPSLRSSPRSGFTLIETLIVISVIGILATIAVPNLVSSRAVANEGAVVGTLRSIATAQFKFKQMGLVDLNANTSFEYGTFGELCGAVAMRGTPEKLAPNVLSLKFGQTDANGRLREHGYFLAVYLPDSTGAGLPELGNLSLIDPALAEDYYSIVAWPISYGASGRFSFFVNQQGELLKSTDAQYSGTTHVPAAGCALLGTGNPTLINGQQLAVHAVGADGRYWVPVN